MNGARRISFAVASSAIYGMLVSIALATIIVNFQDPGARITWLAFLSDLKLIGFFVSLPALIMGAAGGAILVGFRKLARGRLSFTFAGGGIGAILGVVFVGLAFLFDPTTSHNPSGSAPAWMVFVIAFEVGALVGVSYAMIFRQWIIAD